MKKYIPFLCLAVAFFLLKITSLGLRLSDTNIYFYTGYELLQGKLLYKDIFFTNFPVFPYIASLYVFLTRGNVLLFYFTASIEVICTGFIIYHIIYKQTKNIVLTSLTSAIYFFSLIILATSDHQTGVFLASLFATLSYFFYNEKRYKLCGILLGITILTKAYFLPIAAAYFFVFILKKRKYFTSFLLGFVLTVLIILLPFIVLTPHDIYKDIISYSLTRSQGISKTTIAWFFITHDTLFFILILSNIVMIKKHLFLGLCSIFSLLFFIFYKDIYYLYLNFLIPFLCLSFPNLYYAIKQTFSPQKFFVPSIIILFLCYNLFTYLSSYRSIQKINTISDIVLTIQKEHAAYLYGTNDITPLLSYLTKTPLLENIIDTNENIFRKEFLSQSDLTKKAIEKHALIIAHGASYSDFQINDTLMGGIFDKKLVEEHCKLIQDFPVQTEGIENRITIFSCK